MEKNKKDTILERTSIAIDGDIIKKLREDDINISSLVRHLLRKYLEEKKNVPM